MNLEELKTAWSAYDQQIKKSQRIQEQVIMSMITTRSSTRFSNVRKKYILGIVWIAICLVAGVVVLATNPFDYRYFVQFLPLTIYSLCLVIILAGMIGGYLRLNKISVEKETLEYSLKSIIKEYARPKAMMKYALIVLLITAVILFPLSFLPRNIESMGLSVALAERLIPIGISALLLFIAYKLGAFKEKEASHFSEDLSELEQLKAMSKELEAE